MKILYIGKLGGGIRIYIKNTIQALSYTSIEHVIVSGNNDNNQPIISNGDAVSIYKIDLVREPSLCDFKTLVECIKIIRKERPNIIHCHSAKAGFVGRIAGFICGVPTLYTPHAFSFLSSNSRLKRAMFIFLEKFARLNSYMVACSASEQKLGEDVVKYSKRKALLWTNAVPDICVVEDNNPKVVSGDEFNICHIGRPCYQKNLLFLIEVARCVIEKQHNIKFTFYGVGHYSPDLDAVKCLIKQYELEDHIVIKDWIEQTELFERVKESDIYISTAIYEGLPLSILEAMALGKPIVASDVLGNVDCVFDGENGFLLPFEAEMFVEKIVLLYNDYELRKRMGVRSRELFLEHFCIDSQIEKLKQIYEKIANDK